MSSVRSARTAASRRPLANANSLFGSAAWGLAVAMRSANSARTRAARSPDTSCPPPSSSIPSPRAPPPRPARRAPPVADRVERPPPHRPPRAPVLLLRSRIRSDLQPADQRRERQALQHQRRRDHDEGEEHDQIAKRERPAAGRSAATARTRQGRRRRIAPRSPPG